ncbi:RNA-binding protein rnp24 [Smittium culicis]|uniref:RNA-binding protein rnp24 n=1 Tax=Smittium culicis TaxID=133412 RepID=A0A1R1YLB7_9FUNG|nr:RNA-binding protein rnp24 [Smittium culicis]
MSKAGTKRKSLSKDKKAESSKNEATVAEVKPVVERESAEIVPETTPKKKSKKSSKKSPKVVKTEEPEEIVMSVPEPAIVVDKIASEPVKKGKASKKSSKVAKVEEPKALVESSPEPAIVVDKTASEPVKKEKASKKSSKVAKVEEPKAVVESSPEPTFVIDNKASKPEKKGKESESKPTVTENEKKRPAPVSEEVKSQKKLRKDMYPGIWIGNLSFETKKEDLNEFFKNVGKIIRLNMPVKPSKQIKGFAYIDFTTQDEVNKALELNDTYLKNRMVLIKDKVDMATKKPNSKNSKRESGEKKSNQKNKYVESVAPSKTVYVRNLHFRTSKNQLIELAANYGHTINVRLPLKPTNNRKNLGYAFIEYRTIESAEKAIAGIQGTSLDTRELSANFSVLKDLEEKKE